MAYYDFGAAVRTERELGIEASPLPLAKTTPISRPEIEAALTQRGYARGAIAVISVPTYTRGQAIAMGVNQALNNLRMSARVKKETALQPAVWTNLVNRALVASLTLAKKKTKKRTLSF